MFPIRSRSSFSNLSQRFGALTASSLKERCFLRESISVPRHHVPFLLQPRVLTAHLGYGLLLEVLLLHQGLLIEPQVEGCTRVELVVETGGCEAGEAEHLFLRALVSLC